MRTLNAEQYGALEPDLQRLYREKDGAYELAAVPQAVNHGTLEAKRKAEQEAAKLREQLGPDYEEAKALLEEKRKKDAEEAAKKGDAEQLRAKYKASEDRLKAEYDAKLSEANQRESRYVRDLALTNAATRLGVVESAIEDVLLQGERSLKVVEGQLVDKDGDKIDPEKWLKELLAKKKHWLGASVGGGTPPKGSNGAPAGKPRSKMSDSEKLAFIKQHGKDKYLSLPE